MNYRNTEIEAIGMSPSQMFLGRRLNIDLPMSYPLLESANQKSEIGSRMKFCKVKYKFYYDKHAGNKLRPLGEGENIIMQKGKNGFQLKSVKNTITPGSTLLNLTLVRDTEGTGNILGRQSLIGLHQITRDLPSWSI